MKWAKWARGMGPRVRATRGAALVEYAMVVGLIAVAGIGGVWATGTEVKTVFCVAAAEIEAARAEQPAEGECVAEGPVSSTPTVPGTPGTPGVPGATTPPEVGQMRATLARSGTVIDPEETVVLPIERAPTALIYTLDVDAPDGYTFSLKAMDGASMRDPMYYSAGASAWRDIGISNTLTQTEASASSVSLGAKPSFRFTPVITRPVFEPYSGVFVLTLTSRADPSQVVTRTLRVERAATAAELVVHVDHKGTELVDTATVELVPGQALGSIILDLDVEANGAYRIGLAAQGSALMKEPTYAPSRNGGWGDAGTMRGTSSLNVATGSVHSAHLNGLTRIYFTPVSETDVLQDLEETFVLTVALADKPGVSQTRTIKVVRPAALPRLAMVMTYSNGQVVDDVMNLRINPEVTTGVATFTLDLKTNDALNIRVDSISGHTFGDAYLRHNTYWNTQTDTGLSQKLFPNVSGTVTGLRFEAEIGADIFTDQEAVYRITVSTVSSPRVVATRDVVFRRVGVERRLNVSMWYGQGQPFANSTDLHYRAGATPGASALSVDLDTNQEVSMTIESLDGVPFSNLAYLYSGTSWSSQPGAGMTKKVYATVPKSLSGIRFSPDLGSKLIAQRAAYRITFTSKSNPSLSTSREIVFHRPAQ